jgi:hypothetical protein
LRKKKKVIENFLCSNFTLKVLTCSSFFLFFHGRGKKRQNQFALGNMGMENLSGFFLLINSQKHEIFGVFKKGEFKGRFSIDPFSPVHRNNFCWRHCRESKGHLEIHSTEGHKVLIHLWDSCPLDPIRLEESTRTNDNPW